MNKRGSSRWGTCPATFDVTETIRPGEENQIAIQATWTFLNELGTGGLLAPVTLYTTK